MHRPLLVAVVAAVVAAVSPVLPAGASGPAPLAEVTTVTGHGIGATTVTLPRDVRLDFDDAAVITGGGRLAGVSLRQPGVMEFGLLAANLPGGPADHAEVLYTLEGGVLPAGTYRLTVFGTGPISVRLELPGLGGTTAVGTEPAPGTITELDDVSYLPGNRGVAAGAFADMERPGLLLHAVVAELGEGHVTDHGSCFRDGDPLTPVTGWHVCNGSGGGWTTLNPVGGSSRVRAAGFAWDVEPGSRGQGSHVTSDGEVRLVDAVGAWVPLS